MKKKTIEKRRRLKKGRILSIILQSFLYLFIAVIIVVIFACFDFGLKWDSLKEGNYYISAHITLILFRILLYTLPAIIGYFILKAIKKTDTFKKKTLILVDCFNIQFFTFSLVLGIYELLALDYIFNLDILDKMDSFIFIVGFIVSVFIKKEIPTDEINQLDVDNEPIK